MLNLAISDLCLSINGSPSVAYFISPTPNEFFFFTNEAACKANAFALYVASSVSALTICLLAFERYRNVVCQAKISKRNIFFCEW